MIEIEVLHARAAPGDTASPCCGLPLAQFPRYDRIALDDARVTCGRLTQADEAMLTGQPVVRDPEHERTLYNMAATVVALSQGRVDLTSAYDRVHRAMCLVLAPGHPLDQWTAALMVEVTVRAQEMAQQ